MFPTEQRLLVLGADGDLGGRVVSEALWRGHEVAAIVGHDAIVQPAPGLHVIAGNAWEQTPLVRDAIRGQHAVIVASWESSPSLTMTALVRNVVAGMTEQNVSRCVLPLAWGAGESRHSASLRARVANRSLLRRRFVDLDVAESIITDTSDLVWTIGYVGALTDGPTVGSQWAASHQLDSPPSARISRSLVAEFLLDAIDHGLGLRRRLVLSAQKERL